MSFEEQFKLVVIGFEEVLKNSRLNVDIASSIFRSHIHSKLIQSEYKNVVSAYICAPELASLGGYVQDLSFYKEYFRRIFDYKSKSHSTISLEKNGHIKINYFSNPSKKSLSKIVLEFHPDISIPTREGDLDDWTWKTEKGYREILSNLSEHGNIYGDIGEGKGWFINEEKTTKDGNIIPLFKSG